MRSDDEPDQYDPFAPDHGHRHRHGRTSRFGPLAVTLAVVLPLCFAGWLTWQAFGGDGDGKDGGSGNGGTNVSGPSRSARPGTDGPSKAVRPSAPGKSSRGRSDDKARKQPAPDSDRPLAGLTVSLDPGHNVRNGQHPEDINRSVNMGSGTKPCDTVGTSTDSGYTEAQFTIDVTRQVRELLRERGAKVVLTHDGNRPWGPCVDERASLGNKTHADAAVSVHADGNLAASSRGFHVIVPGRVKSDTADTGPILASSRALGEELRTAFQKATGNPRSTYIGDGTGLVTRTDLGGLNLSRVPKVFIECGNMRHRAESRQFTDAAWRKRAAAGIADGITAFLGRRQNRQE
jgi:N-acetylmuramoyl-L-alanine amidase